MPGLVDRDRARLRGDVLDPDRRARLDRRHRLDEVVPAEAVAVVVVRVRERHRADLLDHRRRVAVRDPRDLVAAPRRVEVVLVRDLRDVEVEDVEPILLRRRPEPDVAAHPARPHERGIEPVERDVRRADEVDLVAARARRRQPQRDLAEPARDDVGRVEERVEAARQDALRERRVVDPVHHDEQLVEREPAAASAAHARERELEQRAEPRLEARGAAALAAPAPRRAARARRATRESGRRSR